LCLDGPVSPENEIWLANGLERGGLFVVRSQGGDTTAAIALAELLLLKEATVVVNGYCLDACANYLFIASARTFVPKDAIVAWINRKTYANNCVSFSETSDPRAPRFNESPCTDPFPDGPGQKLVQLKQRFYYGRIFRPAFQEPPESIAVRKILKRKFDATGKYPDDVYWTWNPRFYASAIRTKVFYEAYPQSQDEVDAVVAQLALPLSVIYDP
jgi:hypothetical protein